MNNRLCIIVFCMLSIVASSATYYVDFVGGDDSNAGTSTGAAWKRCPEDTAATGTSDGTTLNAGDVVYYKGGITHDVEMTQINDSGSAGNHIKFISGHLASPQWGTTRAVIDGADATNYTAFEPGIFSIREDDYIWIEGLEIINHPAPSGGGAVQIGRNAAYTETGMMITNCIVRNSTNGQAAIRVVGESLDITVTDSEIYENEGHGIQLLNAISNVLIESCIIYSNSILAGAGDAIFVGLESGSATQGVIDLTIRGCEFYDHPTKGHLILHPATDVLIEDNYGHGTNYFGFEINAGAFLQSWAASSNVIIRNNVIDHNVDAAASGGGSGAIRFTSANDATTTISNVEIYNNVIRQGTGTVFGGALHIEAKHANNFENIQITNNVIIAATGTVINGIWVNQTSGTVTNGFACDYNYYQLATTNLGWSWLGTEKQWDEWQALGWDANSSYGTNGTAELDADYKAASGTSPVVDTGAALTSFTDDKDGVSRPQGAAWDIGAYEWFENWWDVWNPAASGLRIEGP